MRYRCNAAIGGAIARLLAAPIAIGALAAAVVLSVGLSAASAQQVASATPPATASTDSTNNELNQLRANQQLLQQRLDQLEQIAQVGPAHPQLPPGTPSLAGSFPRSFLIPGTDTSIEIGGQVDLDLTEFFHGGSPNSSNSSNSTSYGNASIAALPLASQPLGSAARGAFFRSSDVFYMNVQNTRLFVETRTPTAWGEALTHIEFDFADCPAGGALSDCSNLTSAVNPLLPRLRLAYATLGPWMFGQNWGIGTDLAAAPEAFDSTGIVGTWGDGRVPEVSYTWDFPTMPGASLQAGIVMQQSNAATSAGLLANDTEAVLGTSTAAFDGCTDCQVWLSENPLKNEWPALAAALTWNQPWGHIQAHGSIQDTYFDDGLGLSTSLIGGGGGLSGDFKVPMIGAKDDFGWNVHAGIGDHPFNGDGSPSSYFASIQTNFGGPGSGCYGALASDGLFSTSGSGKPAENPTGCTKGGLAPGLVATQTIGNLGADIWYQHWWTDVLRSTVNFGAESEGLNMSLIGLNPLTEGYNQLEELGLANLIWSPVPFVNTGFEFFYGIRRTVVKTSGTELGLDYSFIMKF
jgi:hypothetical protein